MLALITTHIQTEVYVQLYLWSVSQISLVSLEVCDGLYLMYSITEIM